MAINLDNENIQISKKILSEDITRKKILKRCMQLGCYNEMLQIFNKYDRLMHNCTNDSERQDIAKLGIYEAYNLLERGGKLYVNNELIYVDQDCISNKDN